MPRKTGTDVVTINIRVPKGLHKRLQQLAEEKATSLNATVVGQIERSLAVENWPPQEDLAMVLMLVLRDYERHKALGEQYLDDIGRLLRQREATDPARRARTDAAERRGDAIRRQLEAEVEAEKTAKMPVTKYEK
jgi:HicB family